MILLSALSLQRTQDRNLKFPWDYRVNGTVENVHHCTPLNRQLEEIVSRPWKTKRSLLIVFLMKMQHKKTFILSYLLM